MTLVKQRVFVGQFEQLSPLIGREMNVDGEKIAVFRLSNGDVKAIGGICPHSQGPLAEGIVSGEYVYCPLREYKVSLIDGELQAPDEGTVETYEVVVDDGKVFVLV